MMLLKLFQEALVNPLCPKTHKVCFACSEPCEAPEAHNGLFKEEVHERTIIDVVQHITDIVNINTDFSEEATISVNIPL